MSVGSDMLKIWNKLFLDERPSIGLSFFRIFVALTVGLHVIPSFFHLDDNYLSTAIKTTNDAFFTHQALHWVAQSPDWLVICVVVAFLLTWLFFLIGLFSQLSCILMAASCYYFYALNDFQIGTLSWDILLVTLFLMCVTGYHGDYFSVDALRKKDVQSYKRLRPFFIQRLLQLQVASTFFYTALYKITAQGNWFKDNPIYYLMNYPPMGVTKNFLLKEWMALHPQLCYGAGIFILTMELLLPFLLFTPNTRRSAIIAGCFFHVILILTLDVPAIFFFLFPAQLLLFINPDHLVKWIDGIRERSVKIKVLYDGECGFCKASVRQLQVMDLFGRLDCQPSQEAVAEVKLLEGGQIYGGFFAFRRLTLIIPMLYPLAVLAYLPGMGLIGPWVYKIVANNRYLLHHNRACAGNHCFR
jgi:predicted DCC family thiol-disulfide oxidoreductase YuxK